MVKQLECRVAIDFASPEMVFKILYEDDAFIKFYHKEVNKDGNASATSWADGDGCRCRAVTFRPQFSNAPPFLQHILGGDLSPVTEFQECRFVDNTFIIHSKLSVAVAWGLTFISTGDTILSPLEQGCAIEVKLTLEVQAWYMQEWLENYAELETMVAIKRLLDIARVFCERKLGIVEEPLLEEIHVHSGTKTVSEGNGLHSDAKRLEEERVPPMLEMDGNLTESPATMASPRCSRLRFLQMMWNSFCAIWRNQETLMKLDRGPLAWRQSIFYLRAWTAFGLGVITGLALGFLCTSKHKHLKRKR